MRRRLFSILIIILISVFSTNIFAQSDPKDVALNIFKRYITNLNKGDFNACAGFWNPEYLGNVYKFGISYTDAPYKFDLHSPLLANQQDLASGKLRLQYRIVPISLKEYKVIANLREGDTKLDYEYFLKQSDDAHFYLVPRYWSTIHSMKTYEGKYYKLYFFKSSQLNDSSLVRLDREIEEIGKKLGLDEREMARVEADKIDYVLCENINQVRQLAGHETAGWHDRASNILITCFMPHGQLVAELLVDYRMGEIGTSTIPCLEYGLPVYLGGLPGAEIGAYGELAYYGLDNDMYKVEDLFSYEGFEEKIGGADFAYPLAGYFVQYLEKEISMKGLLSFYKQFSASRDSVEKITYAEKRMKLFDYTDKTMDKLAEDFKTYFAKQIQHGIRWGGKTDGKIVYQSGTPQYSLNIYDDGDSYTVEAKAFEEGKDISCALAFIYGDASYKTDYRPTLFTKHFPNHEFDRVFYSLIFDSQEAGTYDYLSDCITAKHLVSLNSTPEGYDPSHLIYSVDKNLLPADFSFYSLKIIEKP